MSTLGSEGTMYKHSLEQLLTLLLVVLKNMLIVEVILLASTGVSLINSIIPGSQFTSHIDLIIADFGDLPGYNMVKGRSRARARTFEFDFFNAGKLLESGAEALANAFDTMMEMMDMSRPIMVMKFLGQASPVLSLILPFTQAVIFGWLQMFSAALLNFGADSGYWVAMTRTIMRGEAVLGDLEALGGESTNNLQAIMHFFERFQKSMIALMMRAEELSMENEDTRFAFAYAAEFF